MSARSRLVVAAGLVAGLLAGLSAGDASAFDEGKSVIDLWRDSHIQLVPAVGLTRYFEEEAGSLYLTAGYGGQLLAGDTIDFFAGGDVLFGGVGYEFPDQWNVELEYLNSFDSAATTHTFMLTVGIVAY